MYEVRPIDVRLLFTELTEGLDGLSEADRLDTIAIRDKTAIYLLFEKCIEGEIPKELVPKAFEAWQNLNKSFFEPPKTQKNERKKYPTVDDFRKMAYNTFAGVCKLIESGHQNADYYGWQDFQDAIKYCETSEKQRINELATAICCAFDKKTWEKVNR